MATHPSREPSHSQAPSQSTDARPVDTLESRPLAPPSERYLLSESVVTVHAADTSGADVPGATVQVVPRQATVPIVDSAHRFRTDAEGIAVLDLTGRELRESAVLVSAAGFSSGWIAAIEPGGHYPIILQRSHTVTIRCHTSDGRPVPGVSIAASAYHGSLRAQQSSPFASIATGPPDTRRHTTTSGADGLAALDGLLPGLYYIALRHDTHILASRLPEAGGFRCTSDMEFALVFQEPLVAAYAFASEPTIFWRRTPPSVRAPHPTFAFTGGVAATMRERLRESRSSAEPMLSYSLGPIEPPPLLVFAYFPGAGWASFRVPYAKASQAQVATLHPPSGTADVEGTLLVRHQRSDGSPSHLAKAILSLLSLDVPFADGAETLRLPLRITCALGQRLRLPAGRYRLLHERNVLGSEPDDTQIDLAAGQYLEHIVTERVPMGALALDVLDPEGREVDFFSAAFTTRSTGRTLRWDRTAAFDGTVHLPADDYTLTLQCSGFEGHQQEVSVTPDRTIQRLIVPLRRKAH